VSSSDALSLLIVDDHFVVRSGLSASLQLEPGLRVAGDVADGSEALAAYQRTRPDVVLMDLQLPGLDGVAATKALTDFDSDARVLIYSTFERNDELLAAFTAGARGYVSKSASREHLIQAIRAVARGVFHVPAVLARQLSALRAGTGITTREREVLTLITIGSANKEIAAKLGIAEDTVKHHVSSILEKLNAKDRAQAAVEALRRGIVKVASGEL
jgi:DNA-binding NarL/FixJ family response regulator